MQDKFPVILVSSLKEEGKMDSRFFLQIQLIIRCISLGITCLMESDDIRGAKPQSDICTASSLSRRTLVDLKFRWTIGG